MGQLCYRGVASSLLVSRVVRASSLEPSLLLRDSFNISPSIVARQQQPQSSASLGCDEKNCKRHSARASQTKEQCCRCACSLQHTTPCASVSTRTLRTACGGISCVVHAAGKASRKAWRVESKYAQQVTVLHADPNNDKLGGAGKNAINPRFR